MHGLSSFLSAQLDEEMDATRKKISDVCKGKGELRSRLARH